MNANWQATVRDEIEGLHRFFVGWFSGEMDASAFDAGFLARLDPEFVLIPPAGSVLGRDDLACAVRSGHGSNASFRIAIRNVLVRRVLDDAILATYEEWQRNAKASKPPENARVATVLFRRSEPLRWLHVHETWMPEAIAAAGPFDF